MKLFKSKKEIKPKYDQMNPIVPELVEKSISFLEKHSNSVGLFKIAGDPEKIKSFKRDLEKGKKIEFTNSDVSEAADLLKNFFLELPKPISSQTLYSAWISSVDGPQESHLRNLRQTAQLLPPFNKSVLLRLLNFLNLVSQQEINSPKKLSLIFAPIIFPSSSEAAKMTDVLSFSRTTEYITELLISHPIEIVDNNTQSIWHKPKKEEGKFEYQLRLASVRIAKELIQQRFSEQSEQEEYVPFQNRSQSEPFIISPRSPSPSKFQNQLNNSKDSSLHSSSEPNSIDNSCDSKDYDKKEFKPTLNNSSSSDSSESATEEKSTNTRDPPRRKSLCIMLDDIEQDEDKELLAQIADLLLLGEVEKIQDTISRFKNDRKKPNIIHTNQSQSPFSDPHIQNDPSKQLPQRSHTQPQFQQLSPNPKPQFQPQPQPQPHQSQPLLQSQSQPQLQLQPQIQPQLQSQSQPQIQPQLQLQKTQSKEEPQIKSPKIKKKESNDMSSEIKTKTNGQENEEQQYEKLKSTFREKKKFIKNQSICSEISSYIGELDENGDFHGYGKLNYLDGSKYDGQFCHGRLHGKGVMIYSNGSRYEGEFSFGDRHGKGHFVDKTGNIYDGNFQFDQRHGYGTLEVNRSKYEGEFKYGKFHGQGTFKFPNGNIYIGEFENNAMHGFGKFYDAKVDQTFDAFFVNGKRKPQGFYSISSHFTLSLS